MLRLRGGPGPSGEGGEGGEGGGTGGGATAEPQFEALDAIAMSGQPAFALRCDRIEGYLCSVLQHAQWLLPNPSPSPNPNPNPNQACRSTSSTRSRRLANPNPSPNPNPKPSPNPNPKPNPNPDPNPNTVSQPISLVAGETASIPVGNYAVRGERVLVFDPKVSETNP